MPYEQIVSMSKMPIGKSPMSKYEQEPYEQIVPMSKMPMRKSPMSKYEQVPYEQNTYEQKSVYRIEIILIQQTILNFRRCVP